MKKKISFLSSIILCAAMLFSFSSVFAVEDIAEKGLICGSCYNGQIVSYTDRVDGTEFKQKCVHYYTYGHDNMQRVVVTRGTRCNSCGYTVSANTTNEAKFLSCEGYN